MGRPELGTKCTCTGCHERFYDLNRTPAVCPKCGVEQPPEKPRVVRPVRSSFGGGSRSRQAPAPVAAHQEVEPAEASEAEDDAETEDDVPEIDDDSDDELEIDPDIAKTAE